MNHHDSLGGALKYLLFSPQFGEMIQIDYSNDIFQMGWFNHPTILMIQLPLIQKKSPGKDF